MAKSHQGAEPRVEAPMRFLLALPVVTLSTPIKLPRLHHKCDEWLDEHQEQFRLEHERDHRVRSKLGTHRLTEDLPSHTPFFADEECVLRVIHREIAVATRLLVSLLKATQVRVETAMARERLRQIKADFPVLSVQPGGELRDQAVGLSPCLPTMPSHLPLLDESALFILADGLLCASDFLQVSARKLLAELKGLLSFLRQ